MMDMKHGIEVDLANLLQLEIDDVEVLPGRGTVDRPAEYVCVIVEKTEARGGMSAAIASVNVVSVIPADEPDASTRSRRRLRRIVDFFRDAACPFKGELENVVIYGFFQTQEQDAQKDRSFGDIIRLVVGVGLLE